MAKGVRLKSYIDAVNAERNRTSLWRLATLAGTGGAMVYGILQATRVLANTFEKRMDTTNEWRGALEDQNKGKATVEQVQGLEKQIDEIKETVNATDNRKIGAGQLWVIIGAVIVGVVSIVGVIEIFGGLAQ